MHEPGRRKGIRHNHATLGVEAMDRLVVVVGTDELLGLQALAGLDGASDDDAEKLEKIAGLAMRDGLAAKLQEAGLPWAPAGDLHESHPDRAGVRAHAQAAAPARPR